MLSAAFCAAAFGSATAAPAHAGEYHVYGCRTPGGAAVGTDGWARTAGVALPIQSTGVGVTDPAWIGWTTSCSAGGSLGAVMNETTSAQTGGPQWADLVFNPGGGLLITRGSLTRAMSSYGTGKAEIVWRQERASDSVSDTLNHSLHPTGVIDSISGNGSLGNSAVPDWPSNRIVFPIADASGTLTPPPTQAIDVRITCGDQLPCGGASAQLFATDLVLSDPTGPDIDVVGGTIADQRTIPTRTLSGNQSITVSAHDQGVGVDRIRLDVDGTAKADAVLRNSSGDGCHFAAPAVDGLPAATSVRPCPASGVGTISFDTSTIADGSHGLRVLALDGSGSSTVVAEGRVLVRNTDVVGPGSPAEFRGALNGSIATDQAELVAGWSGTARAASKNAKIKRLCKTKAYSKEHAVECVGRPAKTSLTHRWSLKGTKKIVGTLRDPSGHPIADAGLELTVVGGQGPAKSLGTVRTDAQGAFSALVPLSNGSQKIVVGWRARQGDTVNGAAADLSLKVQVASTFAATNLKAGHVVTFSGRIVGGGLVKPGDSIRLQQWTGNAWATFDDAKVDTKGRWKVRRKLTQRATYRMHVAVDDSLTGLYSGIASPAKLVAVR
ncbi:MAG: carboxypeptidase-like regulatory domain-containing protein [Solirubrobacteraceae bacterium]|nr:carboxypeptidase-like regulatory domain-containing protein [Patulibacter sp.]